MRFLGLCLACAMLVSCDTTPDNIDRCTNNPIAFTNCLIVEPVKAAVDGLSGGSDNGASGGSHSSSSPAKKPNIANPPKTWGN